MSDELIEACKELGKDPYQAVLGESDDYELIITCEPENVGRIRALLGSLHQDQISEVGYFTDASDGIRLILPDGSTQVMTPTGWDHFAV